MVYLREMTSSSFLGELFPFFDYGLLSFFKADGPVLLYAAAFLGVIKAPFFSSLDGDLLDSSPKQILIMCWFTNILPLMP